MRPGARPASALALAAVYAAVACAWILFSDRALAAIAPDLSSFAYFQTLKGLFFVLFTAVLVYLVLRRHHASLDAEIEERRRSEEALHESRERLRQSQKLESLGQLAGGVAHDFNNLLMVIRGHAELLRGNKELTPRMRHSCEEIDKAVDRASSLTRQLLTFSRRQTLQLRTLDLNAVVGETTKMLRRLVGEHIEVEVRCVPRQLPVHADSGMLGQVLLNLAVNARDAMPDGGRLIVATTEVGREGRRWACLEVGDDGTGIAPDVLPRIFDPFFTTKEVGKGTGLGLATVFGIAQQHGGSVEADSQVGQGTTFRILLPLSDLPADPTGGASAPAVPGGTETILLVEDDDSVRTAVVEFLRRQGYRVREASSGAEAVALVEREEEVFDLVITDLVMPGGVSGLELGRRLEQRRPGARVIYTSGYSPEIEVRDLDLREGVDFLPKPFELQHLARTLRRRLDER